jgi:3-hydroxyacyl-[acyl-carrier-protein] dehydratase
MARATPTIRTRVMWQKTETNTEGEAQAEKKELGTADILRILKLLPHRYPFLLVDKIVDMDGDSSAVGIKNVTINEPFFQGHFPNLPIMPGVLIVEAIAQAGGALLLTEVEDRDQKLMVFTGIERARFRRPVTPGDQLRIEVEVKSWRLTAVRMEGKVFVGEKRVAEATVTCQLVPRDRKTVEGRTNGENSEG